MPLPDGPDLGQRIQSAIDQAEGARYTTRVFNTIDVSTLDIPVSDNADEELATNWVDIFDATTDELNAGEFTGIAALIFGIDQSNREGWFETFVDEVSLDGKPLKIPVSDGAAQIPITMPFLPDLITDFSVSKPHRIRVRALISPGGGNPKMNIRSIFFLLGQTG